MVIDIEQIKESYKKFSDSKIEYLAKKEIGSLAPEVIEILINEIKTRGLDLNLINGIEAQTKELTADEFTELKTKIEYLPCPECGERNSPLIGTLLRTVKSFIFFTSYKITPLISCETCSEKRIKGAFLTTIFLGWWGIPWGFFRTPQVLIATLLDKKKRKSQSDVIITEFAIGNIGELRTNWDNENELVDFIKHTNSLN